MTEVLGIVAPGAPGVPSAQQLERLGFDTQGRGGEYKQHVFFQTSDAEFPIVPVETRAAVIEDNPRFGPRVIVMKSIKAAFSDSSDIYTVSNDKSATLDVRFTSADMPALGTPERETLLHTCVSEVLRLSTEHGRVGEGEELEVIPLFDVRMNRVPREAEPLLSDLMKYYEDGTPMQTSISHLLDRQFPHQRFAVRRPGDGFTTYRMDVRDNRLGNTEMILGGPAYVPD